MKDRWAASLGRMDGLPLLGLIGLIIIALLIAVWLVLRAPNANRRNPARTASALTSHSVPEVPASTVALAANPAPSPDDTVAMISDLLGRGKKIEAIKAYREQTGVGLKEAKDAVESGAFASALTGFPPVAPVASAPDLLPDPVAAEIDRLLASDAKIEAIKLLRENTGFGLKESKDIIDRWMPSSTP